MDARLASPSVEAIIKDFAYKGSLIGRQRALAKLSRVIGTAAHYEGAQLTGAWAIAVWSRLQPRGPSINSDDPGEQQDCIAIDYIVAGGFAQEWGASSGRWSLDVSDHAMGRLLQRSPNADPEKVLYDAHHAVLRARADDITPELRERVRFCCRADPAFSCASCTSGTIRRAG